MSLQDFCIGLLVLVGISIPAFGIKLGLKLLSADPEEWRINREAAVNRWGCLFGKSLPFAGGDVGRDRSTLAFDLKRNQFVEVGRLTEDAVDRVLR